MKKTADEKKNYSNTMNTEGERKKKQNEIKHITVLQYTFFPFSIFKRNERKTNNLKIDLHVEWKEKNTRVDTRTHTGELGFVWNWVILAKSQKLMNMTNYS